MTPASEAFRKAGLPGRAIPEPGPQRKDGKVAILERLESGFENLSDSGATLVAHWEKPKAGIGIRAEFLETGKAGIKEGLPKAKPDDPFA